MPHILRPDGDRVYVRDFSEFKHRFGFRGTDVDDHNYEVFPRVEYLFSSLNFTLEASVFCFFGKIGNILVLPTIVGFLLKLL